MLFVSVKLHIIIPNKIHCKYCNPNIYIPKHYLYTCFVQRQVHEILYIFFNLSDEKHESIHLTSAEQTLFSS